jgi:zinc protease
MRDGISEDELDRVKASRRGGFVRGIERIGGFGGKSDVLARNAVYAGRPDFYKVQLQRFEEASTASIEAAIDRWLRHGAYHLEVRPFPELSAASEGADRSAVPETASFPEVAFNEFQRDSLSNGLELIVAPRTSIPVINMSLAFSVNLAHRVLRWPCWTKARNDARHLRSATNWTA